MTLCNTCTKADVSCPIYPQETQECVEYSGMLHSLFPTMQAELERSVEKHSHWEWEKLPYRDMYFEVMKEMNEFLLAESKGDMDGEHGMIKELYHAQTVIVRALTEINRRWARRAE